MGIIYNLVAGLFKPHPYYLRISRKRISLRDSSSGNQWEGEPVIVLERLETGEQKIVSVGDSSAAAFGERINPFDHPRLIVADFVLAEKVIQHAIYSLYKKSRFSLSPIVVIHVVEPLEGGVSQIEYRALQELVYGARARKVFIWEGRELTDSELIDGTYKSSSL